MPWPDAVWDGLIALACLLILTALIVAARLPERKPRWVYALLGVAVFTTGTAHILHLEGVTAIASLAAATVLFRLLTAAAEQNEAKERRAELELRVRERTQQLEEANARLADFAATLDKAQTIIQKPDGTILFWNSGAEALYGWTRQEALGRKSHELLKTELPQPFEEIQAEVLSRGHWTGEFRQRCRDGSEIWVASYWALHRNAAGEPVSVVKVNNDITELKRTDAALRISEARARSLFENASQGILTAGPDGMIADANAMALKLFGYSHDELIGASVDMLVPERFRSLHEEYRASFLQHPRARVMGQGLDLVGRRKDGSEFAVEISLSYVAGADKRTGLAMAFISDITARKKADAERESLIARLEAALSEKTVLLKEVHHRVKNNLAVIAGVLGMQADTLADERAQQALSESQQRVLSMALIHEYLYATEHLDRVNFGQYVQQLASELCVTYAVENHEIAVDIDAEEIELSVHRAIPCGLILNELLSNAMKYAFPEGRGGTIEVGFRRLETEELSLVVKDDGVGIPAGFDWQNANSLGLRIVRILTKQIDGTLRLDGSHGGARFELRFPPRQH